MNLPRVLFVTGKGGTGKSTIAAALALALSHRGRTTLIDLEGRATAASMIGAAPQASASAHDSLMVVSLTQRAELNSFVRRIVPVAAISERMLRSRTFGYVTAALPGLEAFLLLERIRIMAGEAALEDRHIVIDAPASGGALELLAIAAGVKGIAPTGTLNRLADEVEAFLRDAHRFAAVVTLTPGELAVREALETIAALRDKMQIAVAGAILNQCAAPLFDPDEVRSLSALGGHRALAHRRLAEQAATLAARAQLEQAATPVLELPMLYRAEMGARAVSTLARTLAAGMLSG
jgi:arsenite-transporting ATPase